MSSLRLKYIKILTIYCFVSMTIGVHDIAGNSKVSFCDKLANAKPSPLFSFDSLLRLQMFTFEFDEDIVMVADGIRYVLNAKDLVLNNYESILIPIDDIHKPWLSDQFINPPDSIGKIASIVRLASGERLEMGYKIGAGNARLVVLVSNMYIYVYSDERTVSANSRPLLSMKREGTLFSIVHDQLGHLNSNAYVISRAPNDTGLLIYSLKLRLTPNTNKIEADCQVIVNSRCMERRNFFYLQRDFVTMQARLVNPEKGNAKLANFVPLAALPPIGFIYHSRLFLFDINLGCVYIIENWNRPDLDSKFITADQDIPLVRKNVPFERFFRCAQLPDNIELFHFLAKNRCETTMQSSIMLSLDGYTLSGALVTVITDKIDVDKKKLSQSKWDGKTIAIYGAIFFFVGMLVFAAITILIQRKSRREAKKVSGSKIDFRRNRRDDMFSSKPKQMPRHDYAKRRYHTSSIGSAASSNNSTYATPPVYYKKNKRDQKRIYK